MAGSGIGIELGADILRTAVAPTWSEIGQLAAIATLRTALNFFLQQEIDRAAIRRQPETISSTTVGDERKLTDPNARAIGIDCERLAGASIEPRVGAERTSRTARPRAEPVRATARLPNFKTETDCRRRTKKFSSWLRPS